MAGGHPTDDQGRSLPECTWPTGKAAPDGLDLIRRFCNTCNLESGADRFETLDGLRSWLREQGLSNVDGQADESDRRRLLDVRERLRTHALAHHDGIEDGPRNHPFDGRIADIPVSLAVDEGQLTIRATGHDVASRTIGVLAVAVMESQRSDRWRRFKACRGCGWVFYDRSKNLAGRWCSMNACGGRAKVAAFRDRQRAGST